MNHENLNRFLEAQECIYANALQELKSGRKRTHWMWFIFPQIDGLGHSVIARRYAIKGREEAQQYLNHRVLGNRLRECTRAVVDIEGRTISQIFAFPDDLKFASCMTLFSQVAEDDALFDLALEKYFDGALDARTLELL
jgi:uncharacterized protein (DUF1810 family)